MAIIGAGLMGNGLAQVFARDPDSKVTLRDVLTKPNPFVEGKGKDMMYKYIDLTV